MPIFFTQPIRHGEDRLHTAMLPPGHQPPRPRGLFLGTFNIYKGQDFLLAQDIQAVYISRLILIILTKTKIIDQDYFRNRLVYDVVCLPEIMTVDGCTQGGVSLVVQYQP